MIVIWRRIRRAVGGIGPTEWALLGLETLGVIIGILIAFQLQQWATDRRDAARLERIEDQLLEEARTAVGLVWERVSQSEASLALATTAARDLAAGQCPSDEAFQSLYSTGFYEMIDPPSGIYDELVGSVGVSALSADARLAVDFYRNNLNRLKGQLPYFRANRDIVRPEDPRIAMAVTDQSEDVGLAIDYDREALCADPEFADEVNFAVRNQARFQQYRNDLLDDAAFLCVVLAEEQGRRCTGEWVEQLITDPDTRADIERRGKARWEAADL